MKDCHEAKTWQRKKFVDTHISIVQDEIAHTALVVVVVMLLFGQVEVG